MRKTIYTLALLTMGSLMAQGALTWIGGATITQEGWQNQDNWQLTDDTTWNTSGTGPQSPGSEMWAQTNVSNASGSVDKLEGWNLRLNLENTQLTVNGIKKFQGGGCNITIDENSSLTIDSFGYASGNDGGIVNLTNYGIFNMAYNKNQGGNGFNVDLGSTGIMNLTVVSGNHTAKISSLAAVLDGTGLQSRELITLGSGMSFQDSTTFTFTDAEGNAMVAVDSEEALATATENSYFVNTTANGYSVSYVIVPEPATASLSLLGLAALMMRRRRA